MTAGTADFGSVPNPLRDLDLTRLRQVLRTFTTGEPRLRADTGEPGVSVLNTHAVGTGGGTGSDTGAGAEAGGGSARSAGPEEPDDRERPADVRQRPVPEQGTGHGPLPGGTRHEPAEAGVTGGPGGPAGTGDRRPSARSHRKPAPRRPADECAVPPRGQPPAAPSRGPRIGTHGIPSNRAAPAAGGPRSPVRHPSHAPGGASAPAANDDADGEPGEAWALVTRVQEGDGEAFALIYDRYLDMVYRYIFFRIGSRAQAEDLTSETFLRAFRRIARNLVVDHYKSGRQRLEVTTADMMEADRVAVGPEGHPESAVLTLLDNATLLDAVRQLNPEQQECIRLRFLQGLSVTETAQVMEKNEGAIKALQYRAVRTLGRLLPEGFTP
jgi:RNA polymerase sigma-70 factor (ECF subfamily)